MFFFFFDTSVCAEHGAARALRRVPYCFCAKPSSGTSIPSVRATATRRCAWQAGADAPQGRRPRREKMVKTRCGGSTAAFARKTFSRRCDMPDRARPPDAIFDLRRCASQTALCASPSKSRYCRFFLCQFDPFVRSLQTCLRKMRRQVTHVPEPPSISVAPMAARRARLRHAIARAAAIAEKSAASAYAF